LADFGTAEQLAEKVGVATEAFAAAKAGRSFCSLFGTTKGHALLQSASQECFSASCKAVPFQKAIYATSSIRPSPHCVPLL
jgi:hypothetical protein